MTNNNFIKTYLYGGIAGIAETTITYPIDYYKVMIQNKKSYSFPQFISQQYKNYGFRGLYHGYIPRVIGIIPMRSIFWGTQTVVYRNLPNDSPNYQKHMISGIIAGGFQTIVDTPIELLKIKKMTQESKKMSFIREIRKIQTKELFPILS